MSRNYIPCGQVVASAVGATISCVNQVNPGLSGRSNHRDILLRMGVLASFTVVDHSPGPPLNSLGFSTWHRTCFKVGRSGSALRRGVHRPDGGVTR